MKNLIELFYKFMYRKKIIKIKVDSGRVYIIEYHRSPFWTNEDYTLKLFFKKKIKTWHGRVWEVFENGGRCGFGSVCIINTIFPRREMKKFLIKESNCIEKILNKEN